MVRRKHQNDTRGNILGGWYYRYPTKLYEDYAKFECVNCGHNFEVRFEQISCSTIINFPVNKTYKWKCPKCRKQCTSTNYKRNYTYEYELPKE